MRIYVFKTIYLKYSYSNIFLKNNKHIQKISFYISSKYHLK